MGRRRKLFDGSIPAIAGQEVRFHAVCVFAPEGGRPVKIACRASRPRIETRPRDGDGILQYNVWVVDRGQARAIKQECHRVLEKAHKRIDKHHFDVTVEWAKKVILFAGQERGIKLYTNDDLAKMAITPEQLNFIEVMRQTGTVLPKQEYQRILGT